MKQYYYRFLVFIRCFNLWYESVESAVKDLSQRCQS